MTSARRFDSLQQLRIRQRDMAAGEVNDVLRAIRVLEERKTQFNTEIASLSGERKQFIDGSVEVQSLLEIERYQMVLIGQLQHLAQQRTTLEDERVRREAILMKCQLALKSVEKLQEKQLEDQVAHEQTLLQHRLDEWSNTRNVAEKAKDLPR